MKKITAIFAKLPKGLVLVVLLVGTMALDGLMYGFLNTCPACTSFSQFITMPQALSSGILASLTALFSLTTKQK
jgi:hypothetical protein